MAHSGLVISTEFRDLRTVVDLPVLLWQLVPFDSEKND